MSLLRFKPYGLDADEVSDITSRMKKSAGDISRLTRQLKEAANNRKE